MTLTSSRIELVFPTSANCAIIRLKIFELFVLDMGLFSCCTTNVVDSIVTEDLSEEKVQNRKVTSASSKESKDSGK